jgi:hypothetical protein
MTHSKIKECGFVNTAGANSSGALMKQAASGGGDGSAAIPVRRSPGRPSDERVATQNTQAKSRLARGAVQHFRVSQVSLHGGGRCGDSAQPPAPISQQPKLPVCAWQEAVSAGRGLAASDRPATASSQSKIIQFRPTAGYMSTFADRSPKGSLLTTYASAAIASIRGTSISSRATRTRAGHGNAAGTTRNGSAADLSARAGS